MEAWPATLPPPLAEGARFAPAFDGIIKSQMEVGPFKRRRRVTRVPETFTGTILLNAAQYTTFKAFVELVGTSPFTWKDWRTGAAQNYAFVTLPTFDHVSAGLWHASLELVQA